MMGLDRSGIVRPHKAKPPAIDTNILFSALISPRGAPDTIYRAWRTARFEIVTSRLQLDEVRRASRYPKLQAVRQPARVGVMINSLQRALVLKQLPRSFEADDAFRQAMADAGRADYLVTGDRRADVLERGHAGHTRILTPAMFGAEVPNSRG